MSNATFTPHPALDHGLIFECKSHKPAIHGGVRALTLMTTARRAEFRHILTAEVSIEGNLVSENRKSLARDWIAFVKERTGSWSRHFEEKYGVTLRFESAGSWRYRIRKNPRHKLRAKGQKPKAGFHG